MSTNKKFYNRKGSLLLKLGMQKCRLFDTIINIITMHKKFKGRIVNVIAGWRKKNCMG